jgi:hypothetical protein
MRMVRRGAAWLVSIIEGTLVEFLVFGLDLLDLRLLLRADIPKLRVSLLLSPLVVFNFLYIKCALLVGMYSLFT